MIFSFPALIGVLSLGLQIGTVHVASGELNPNQIAILSNRNSADSMAIARHYATRRNIPPDHIIALDVPVGETMSRDQYERQLIRPVREALKVRDLASTIITLVTIYGIPLKVQAPRPTDQERAWRKDATERHRFARAYLEKIPAWAMKVAASGESGIDDPKDAPPGTGPGGDPDSDHAILERLGTAIRDAVGRVQRARDREPPEKLAAWNNELARISLQVGGMAAIVQNLQTSPGADPKQAQAELAQFKQQVASAEAMIQILAENPSETNRKKAYQLAERAFGLQGILRLAASEMDAFSYQAGDASVDSELNLLWWDSDMYRIAGRLPNPLHYERAFSKQPSVSLPVLMVSRLDAPTADLTMQLVNQALETERRGLTGNVYVDARGLQPHDPQGYGLYDQNLRDLADLFRRHTSYRVVLDNAERRFSEPGEAPDVAVYVGWYHLRSYEDAFAFVPGALGYHIASAEAISLHDPRERGWCKNALERGITVTLGSTGEPYLDAFPLPNELFAVLLTGRYSLVEAYALTTRYTSWRMTLIGDPLYNPWRGKDLVKTLGGILRSTTSGSAWFPPAPSTHPIDPVKARHELNQTRKAQLSQVNDFLMQMERRNPGSAPPGVR